MECLIEIIIIIIIIAMLAEEVILPFFDQNVMILMLITYLLCDTAHNITCCHVKRPLAQVRILYLSSFCA